MKILRCVSRDNRHYYHVVLSYRWMVVICMPNDFRYTNCRFTSTRFVVLSDNSCYADEHPGGFGGGCRLQSRSPVHDLLHVDWEYILWGHRLHVQGEFITDRHFHARSTTHSYIQCDQFCNSPQTEWHPGKKAVPKNLSATTNQPCDTAVLTDRWL